jgi:ABC-type dipeptide/oligopeptide/nickel transport system permease subunit
MSWWSPPLFPGHHRIVAGWRWYIGRLASGLFELLDLFPRVILLLFVCTIGSITLGRFCLAVGLFIALQVASGVRQHANELRRTDTVASAEELGLSPVRIVWGHIVWNHLQGFVLSQYAFAIGAFVLWNATLGYLGFADPTHNSWGQIIHEGIRHTVPWMTWSASIVTVLVVLGLFRLSDGIERWKTSE